MEDPIFYQANPPKKPLTPYRRKMLINQLIELKRDAARLERRVHTVLQYCQRAGIVLPRSQGSCFRNLRILLQGTQNTLNKK